MFIIVSAIAAIVPMLGYLIIIWWLDKYDREPIKLILQNFLWGAIGAVFFASIGSLILEKGIFLFFKFAGNTELFGPLLFGPLLIAPVVEESTKGIFLLFTMTKKEFDNITDGLVYGGAIGLGFGMTENFLYFISYGTSLESWIVLVLVRSMFSAVMHCISTGTLGTFLALGKFSRRFLRLIYPVAGLILAFLIHFTWNFTVSKGLTILIGILFILFASVVFLAVFLFSVSRQKQIIIRELTDETAFFPKEHIGILVSQRRHRKGWIDERIRKDYIKALITLAFRKMQYRQTSGTGNEFYALEIENYRTYIKTLLNNSY